MNSSPGQSVFLHYRCGDTVYLRCRTERVKGMVTAAHIYPTGKTFSVTWGNTGTETVHYAFELDTEFTEDFDAT